jgi:hypothetical protein
VGVFEGPVSELQVTPQQAAAADKVAGFIRRHGLVTPAVLWLESVQPLAFVGSQFMHLLSPTVQMFLPESDWDALAGLLEDRRGMNYLLTRIERPAEVVHG